MILLYFDFMSYLAIQYRSMGPLFTKKHWAHETMLLNARRSFYDGKELLVGNLPRCEGWLTSLLRQWNGSQPAKSGSKTMALSRNRETDTWNHGGDG